MTPSFQRWGITLALLGFVSILPGTVEAQCSTYLTQWGSTGMISGQFIFPFGVATDVTGDVYVADAGNHRIQKFTSTGAYVTQ